MIISYLICFIG